MTIVDASPETEDRDRPDPPSRRAARNRITQIVAIAAATAAVFAPATLTGSSVVDAVERALLAAAVTFIGAHAHRWTWFVAGIILVVPASGVALALVLAGLVVAVATTRTRRRPKDLGSVAAALFVNGALWFGPHRIEWLALACALAACLLLVVDGYGSMRRRHRRMVRIPLFGTVALIVLATGIAAVTGLLASNDLVDGTKSARTALASVQDGDADVARDQLERARTHLDRAGGKIRLANLPARLVPGLAQQMDAVDVAVSEGRHIAAAADDLLASADYDQLRYKGRLDLSQVDVLQPQAANVHQVMTTAQSRLDQAAEPWLAGPLRTRIEEFRGEVADVSDDTDLAAELLDLAPTLFGADQTRHYLIIFMTNAELRGAGGFIGSYAELEATDGSVELTRSGSIKDLVDQRKPGERTLDGPADYVRRYGRLKPWDFLQDVTISPDFPSDADVMAQLYPQSGGHKVDGVIGIDPSGLASLLKLTGPVDVEGLDEPLTADNAVHILTKRQYLDFSKDEDSRKELLEAATRETFKKLTKASLPAPRKLGDVLGPAVRGRHIQVWSPTAREQALFERVHADGAIAIAEGSDGFTIAEQNLGNNKIDAYLQRSTTYDVTVDAATGKLTANLQIVLDNKIPDIPFPPYVVSNSRAAPQGTNVTTLAIYSPHRLVSAMVDGQEVTLGEDTELGLNVYETGVIRVPPRGQVTLELELEGAVDLRRGYHLEIIPQPMVNAEQVSTTLRATKGKIQGADADGLLTRNVTLEETLHLAARLLR